METQTPQNLVSMDEITALAKRRGFIFQSSEIYGGIDGFLDYGPLGAVLKRNVKDAWWRETVELRDDVVAFDSSIIMHPRRVEGFRARRRFSRQARRLQGLQAPLSLRPSQGQAPVSGLREQRQLTEPRNFNLDDEDAGRADGRYGVARVPAPRDRSGHLRQLQKRLSDRAQTAAVRHRADREVVPQRDHAGQLHVPRARVRAGRARVFRAGRRQGSRCVPRVGRAAQGVVLAVRREAPTACVSTN